MESLVYTFLLVLTLGIIFFLLSFYANHLKFQLKS